VEVSGQLHAPAALPHGKSAWYTFNRRVGKFFFTEFLNIKNDHPHPHYTFCHVCGYVSWALLPWSRDWSWWSASQAIKISKPQIPDFYLWGGGHMQDLLYEQKVKELEELDTLICHFGCCDLCQG